MSFSSQVKDELSKSLPESEHCLRAELAAIISPERALRDPYLLNRLCCKKSFLRGLFLSAGSITDPEKEYQLELVCHKTELADFAANLLNSFSVSAKIVERKGYYVVYLKGGDQVVHFLGLIGASGSLLNLENVRVLKDVRNSINRQVNCETANLNKTIAAAVRKIKEIEFIRDRIGFDNIPENLRSIAEARIAHPEASLTELGEMLTPPIGKSAVNHRLRKLSEIAEEEGYDNEKGNGRN